MADEPKTYTEDEVNARIAEAEKGLKSNRDEALREAKAAKAALKNYEGVDPEEFKKLKTQADEAAQKKAAAEGDFNSLKKQLIDQHTSEIGGRDTKIGKLQKALERRLVDAELTRAIAAKKGEPDLLLPYARQFVRVKETDDDFEGFVADLSGNPLVADGKGTPMDFDTFVEQQLMVKFPRAFEGTGSSGGGASKSTGGAGGSNRVIAIPADGRFSIADLEAIGTGKATVAG